MGKWHGMGVKKGPKNPPPRGETSSAMDTSPIIEIEAVEVRGRGRPKSTKNYVKTIAIKCNPELRKRWDRLIVEYDLTEMDFSQALGQMMDAFEMVHKK